MVRSDVDVAMFLLPSTVVEVLKLGNEHVDFIKEEVSWDDILTNQLCT